MVKAKVLEMTMKIQNCPVVGKSRKTNRVGLMEQVNSGVYTHGTYIAKIRENKEFTETGEFELTRISKEGTKYMAELRIKGYGEFVVNLDSVVYSKFAKIYEARRNEVREVENERTAKIRKNADEKEKENEKLKEENEKLRNELNEERVKGCSKDMKHEAEIYTYYKQTKQAEKEKVQAVEEKDSALKTLAKVQAELNTVKENAESVAKFVLMAKRYKKMTDEEILTKVKEMLK